MFMGVSKLRVKQLPGTVCEKLQVKFIKALTEGVRGDSYPHPGLGSLHMAFIRTQVTNKELMDNKEKTQKTLSTCFPKRA